MKKAKSRKGSKGSSDTKNREKSEEDRTRLKKRLAAVIVAVILIVAVLLMYFFHETLFDGEDDGIDRSIEFPRDEGSHDETHEFWRVAFLLSSDQGDRFGVAATYTKYSEAFGGQNERLLLITDEGNVSGETFYSKRYFGNLTAEEGRLNLSYEEPGGLDRDSWVQLEGFNYSYSAELYDVSIKVAAIDLTINYLKPPILIGDEGKIFDATKNFGTIYGYSQTRLLVQGTLNLSGILHNVQGLAWIDHQWGSWSYTNKEYWQLQLENGIDITIFRLFSPGELVYQHFYEVDVQGRLSYVVEYDIENLKYVISPIDIIQKRCVSTKWRFTSSALNLTSESTVKYQFTMAWGTEGTMNGSGILSGSNVDGRGYATIHNHALTTLSINEVNHIYDPLGTFVTANVTDDIPITNVTLYYNTSLDSNLTPLPMSYIGDDKWECEIGAQPLSTTVYYFVEAYDLADAYKKSDWYEYTVT